MNLRRFIGVAATSALALSACTASPSIETAEQSVLTPPPDSAFYPFQCDGQNSFDHVDDSHSRDVDIVGDQDYPALYRAADSTNLYLRMRLNGDPNTSSSVDSRSWAFLFDTDGDYTSFEYISEVDGVEETLTWQQNETQDPPNSPADVDRTLLHDYVPFEDYVAYGQAQDGSNFDNNPDYFLTVALPIADLNEVGISTANEIALWAATSNNKFTFKVDLSCDDGDNDLEGNETDGDEIIPECTVDSDGDGVCDLEDPCPLDNPDDSDGDGICDSEDDDPNSPCVDTDGDGVCDSDDGGDSGEGGDNCDDVFNPDQQDSDGDGIGDACDDTPNGDDDPSDDPAADGAFGLTGGGCSTSGSASAWWLLIAVFGIGWMLRRRRLRGGATVLALSLLSTSALAQTELSSQFSSERFRLTTTSNGIFDVETGTVPKHMAWNIGAWLGISNDTLVAYDREDPDMRLGSVVGSRLAANLVGSLALYDRLAIGLTVPTVLYQDGDDVGGLQMSSLNSGGIGDIEVDVKGALMPAKSPLGVAVRAALILPTASSDDSYFGEETIAFRPEAIVSYVMGPFRAAANLGMLLRDKDQALDLTVNDELYYRLGVAYRAVRELELAATLTQTTSLQSPFDAENEGLVEGLLGATYRVPKVPVGLFFAGGGAVNEGYGGADWRVVGGARYATDYVGDKDGDGYVDPEDGCPLQPEDFDKFEDADGCPDPDNDQDRVLDVDDGAPLDPEDHDQFEDEDGIPDPDNDQDGIVDVDDQCPNEAETLNQIDDTDGCPEIDYDGDKLLGSQDQCPKDPEDFDGFQDEDGCSDQDNDGDGIADDDDKCRDVPETINQFEDTDGCPDEIPDEIAKFSGVIEGIRFQTGRAKIRRSSYRILRNAAKTLNKYPDIILEIQGHTDSVGKDERNMKLSDARAQAVMDFLIKQGVSSDRLTSRGYGETVPIADNTTKAGRAQNRRVEFIRR